MRIVMLIAVCGALLVGRCSWGLDTSCGLSRPAEDRSFHR